jgi:hypothetical protein
MMGTMRALVSSKQGLSINSRMASNRHLEVQTANSEGIGYEGFAIYSIRDMNERNNE